MHLLVRFFHQYVGWLCIGFAVGALGLLWYVYDTPLQLTRFIRADALSTFFLFVISSGLAVAVFTTPYRGSSSRFLLAILILPSIYLTTSLLAIAAGYLILALLMTRTQLPKGGTLRGPLAVLLHGLSVRLVWMLRSTPAILAGLCLLVGYSTIAWYGAPLYSDRVAGAGLGSLAFCFVLLAAVIPASQLVAGEEIASTQCGIEQQGLVVDTLRIAWLYPLIRLYTLGPWNNGWSFATLLLGIATAFWSSSSTLGQPNTTTRSSRSLLSYLSIAVTGIGLCSSAGLTAGCYAVLTYLVLSIGRQLNQSSASISAPDGMDNQAIPLDEWHLRSGATRWLLSGAVPFTAPFVATWMILGASTASGFPLISGAAWLILLLNALAIALAPTTGLQLDGRTQAVAAGASVALGVFAPVIVRMLIQPIVQQLQGGLTPFGDLNVWPWIGIAAADAAHTQVSALPSIAVAALMLVLSCLVYLIARLYELIGREPPSSEFGQPVELMEQSRLHRLIALVRIEVPWLGSAEKPSVEEQHIDDQ